MCDETKNATDSVSTKVTNTIPANIENAISANVASTAPNKFCWWKRKIYVLFFVYIFISDHITIHNRYYLLSLHKT